MNKNETMNQKERVMGFVYVLLIFLSITTFCCLALFLYNSDYGAIKQKDFFVSKMLRIGEFRNDQKKAAPTIDLLYNKIAVFNPGVNAVYDEDNIKFLIKDLKEMYEKNSLDTRYKSFQHIADFYYQWYADKRALWTLNTNIDKFTKELEACELGLANKKDDFAKLKK